MKHWSCSRLESENMACSYIDGFFTGKVDHCERLVSLFEHCSQVGGGNSSAATQDWVSISLHDDEVYRGLEKGMYYKGMMNVNEITLLEKSKLIHKKFSEMRERLELFPVAIDISRRTVLEANMAKEPGVKEGRPNPLGLPDLMKPEGWTAPSHEGNHGILPKLKGE